MENQRLPFDHHSHPPDIPDYTSPHAVGLEEILRYRRTALHYLELLPSPAAAGAPERRDLLLLVLERMRARYQFGVVGYVVMPEHVHLLVSEPQAANPSTVIQAVKLGFTRRALAVDVPCPVWQRRFYDFNVWSKRTEIEKLKYMHRNPVVRGLVIEPGDWRCSSYRSYAYGEPGMVRINDWKRLEEKIQATATLGCR